MTTNRKQTHRVPRIALIAVVTVVVLGLAVGAAAYVGFTRYENPSAMLDAFFGENGTPSGEGVVEYDEEGKLAVNLPGWERVPVDESLADELIGEYISAETSSISWGEGYTLTVVANLYDPQTECGLLYYTVENPSGVTGYEVEVNGQFGWCLEPGNVFTRTDRPGETYIDEAMSTDTVLYICEYYVNWELADSPAELEISVGEQVTDPEPAYEGAGPGVTGEVQETVRIQLEDGGGMRSLVLAGGDIVVSPIGMRIDEEALGFDPASSIKQITLRYADGSEYVLLDDDGFISNRMYALGQGVNTDTHDGPYHTTHLFNRIVDIDSLTEIVLDGTAYPVT